MKLQYLASLVASLPLVTAQTLAPTISAFPSEATSLTDTETLVASATGAATTIFFSTTAVPTSEACLAVSSVLATQTGAPYQIPADLANECASSVPIFQDDALLLVDGIMAALEFQSDLKILANPPADYPLAGVDLMAELQQIRDQVTSGAFAGEFEFQQNVTAALGKAQDGHLVFQLDGLATFGYLRQFKLISVSSDGKQTPELYEYSEYEAYLAGTGQAPSAVTHVNGQELVQFLQTEGQNVSYGGFQDPDALYNMEFHQLSNNGNPFPGLFTYSGMYKGASTTLTYADGSENTLPNYAVWNSAYDFTGLVDGASLYNICCNWTAKYEYYYGNTATTSGSRKSPVLEQYESFDKTELRLHHHRVSNLGAQEHANLGKRQIATATAAATATQIPGYPTPIALSSDLAFSGYFLDDYAGFEDTAVIVMTIMSEGDPENFVQTMTSFMEQCRNAKKTHLVIDVQGNGGGTIAVGYEVFRQLFPDIWPYGAGTMRAHEGLDVLGNIYTNITTQLVQEQPDNLTLLETYNYYTQYAPKSYQNDSGQLFGSWAEFYGPVDNGVDNYTNLIRWDLNNTDFAIAGDGGFALAGFGNSTELPPSPFSSDNIIILSNGLCSSTCTIFAHFMKYQGKVKSIAVGGRPQTTAMQSVGGIKGSQVYYYGPLYHDVGLAYETADASGYTDQVAAIGNSKTLSNILNNGTVIYLRGANAGTAAGAKDFSFNWQNNIAEGDTTYTPGQFVYEAADCHLWYQPQHINDVSTLWTTAAAQAFGLNSTDVFSLCVEGSTNASSSLSGNATLFNNGNPTNITTFQPEEADTNGKTTGGGGNNSGVGRLAVSSMSIACAIATAMFML